MNEAEKGNFHGQDIIIGTGRIVWVDNPPGRVSGWVLPGGEITTNAEYALIVARIINSLTLSKKPK